MTNRTRGFIVIFLGAAWFVCGDAKAQAHGPPATEFLDVPEPDTPKARAAKVAEINTFLRRLVGRFSDTQGERNDSERLVDCQAIGKGPGVQCMFGLGSRSGTGGGTSAQMFGVDPGAAKVNFLLVDTRGVAEGGLGKLSGNTLYIKFPCKLSDDADNIISCETRLQYYVLAAAKEVGITTTRIMRVKNSKGMPQGTNEVISTSYTWLNKAMGARSSKSGRAGVRSRSLSSRMRSSRTHSIRSRAQHPSPLSTVNPAAGGCSGRCFRQLQTRSPPARAARRAGDPTLG